MKKLFYIMSLIISLTACGEKAEEKAFIDKNVKSFLEYTDIAEVAPRIQLSNVLIKMSELKMQLSNYNFSNDCQKCANYAIEHMTNIQKLIKSSLLDNLTTKDYNDSVISNMVIHDMLKYNTCKEFQRRMQTTEVLLKEIEKDKPDISIIKMALNNGADINFKNNQGNTPLFVAVSNNNLDIVQVLVEAGADVNAKNSKDMTALMGAIINDSTLNIAKFLIRKGADVNARAYNGSTALAYAFARYNSQTLDIIKFLVENGADVNVNSYDGYSALMQMFIIGVDAKSLDIAQFLIKSGINVNARSINGMTALRYVVGSDSPQSLDVIKLLIESGADVNARDGDGLTILSVASKNKNPHKTEIIKLLKEHGAK